MAVFGQQDPTDAVARIEAFEWPHLRLSVLFVLVCLACLFGFILRVGE